MQIIWKEKETGVSCLYDTRSNNFLEGGCTQNPTVSSLLEVANQVVRKSSTKLLQMATDFEYGDDGYTESMIASAYLKVNPDLLERAREKNKLKSEKSSKAAKFTKFKKKGRKPKAEKPTKVERREKAPKPAKAVVAPKETKIVVTSQTTETTEKRMRGRPRKNP